MQEPIYYHAKRNVITYIYLYNTSKIQLKLAEEQEEGSFYFILSSLTFSAFTLEAYLNHLGKNTYSHWQEIETSSVKAKLFLLSDYYKVELDKSKRPFQTIEKLIKFRNLVAHGKTVFLEDVVKRTKVYDSSQDQLLETQWEQLCKYSFAKRALEDMEVLIKTIHKATGGKRDPFKIRGVNYYNTVANPEE